MWICRSKSAFAPPSRRALSAWTSYCLCLHTRKCFAIIQNIALTVNRFLGTKGRLERVISKQEKNHEEAQPKGGAASGDISLE